MLVEELVDSLLDGNVAVVTGAGLSMAPPSGLPSAAALADHCRRTYFQEYANQLPDELGADLELIADFFWQRSDLRAIFIRQLVPWSAWAHRPENAGHVAVADFAESRAARVNVTANYDRLVENAAHHLGGDLYSALDGDAAAFFFPSLLKLHGCQNERQHTLWCKGQLNENTISRRLQKSRDWLRVELKHKDLIFVGFWTDWSYLNDTLESCVTDLEPRRVVVIDPAEEQSLESKSPNLWAWANSGNFNFYHVKASGAEFLDGLRRAYSERFLTLVLNQAASNFEAALPPQANDLGWLKDLDMDDLYSLRRAISGKTFQQAVDIPRPNAPMNFCGYACLLLRSKNGVFERGVFRMPNGDLIRVISAVGLPLHRAKAIYGGDASPAASIDYTVCAGSEDLGMPASIIDRDAPQNIIRGGGARQWLTLPGLVKMFGEGE